MVLFDDRMRDVDDFLEEKYKHGVGAFGQEVGIERAVVRHRLFVAKGHLFE